MTKIIEAEGLTKIYKGKVKAVDHISFSVEEGEIFGFLGPNGAGKTTTIKMLNTLASITEGRASVAGHDVSKEPGAIRDSIGVVPQELTADDELKGVENLMLTARLHQRERRSQEDAGAAKAGRPRAGGRQEGEDLFGRNEEAVAARDGPRAHAEGPLP
jgi:ABC-2 type transport system ATP-binding protein